MFGSCNKENKHSIQEIEQQLKGYQLNIENNRKTAFNHLKIGLQWSQTIDYKKGISSAFAGFAQYYLHSGRYDSALIFIKKAQELSIQNLDTLKFIDYSLLESRIYSSLNQNQLVLKKLIEVKPFVKQTNNHLFISKWCCDMAYYFVLVEETDSIYKYYKMAFDNGLLSKDKQQLNISMSSFATILNRIGKEDSAVLLYRDLINDNITNNNWSNLAIAYFNLSQVFINPYQADSVKLYLNKAFALKEKDLVYDEVLLLYEGMINYYEIENNFQEALALQYEKEHLKDSFFNINTSSQIANIEKDYTVKLKSEENAKLASELKRKNTLRNASIITALLLALLGLYQFRSYKQKRKILEAEKELKDQEINQLLKTKEVENLEAIIEGREAEQKRIGRDLHDRLGSILSTVKMHFSAIDEKIDALKSENKIQYEKASTLLDEAVSEVRKIAHDLSSGVLVKQGFKAAVVDLINTIESSGKIQVNFYEAGDFKSPNLEFEISLYRIIQELISNILKHANATKIDIHLTQQANQLTLIIEDNGKGFNTQNSASFGIGIANVKQRVAGIAGEITFDSHIGKGCSVIIEINL